MDIIQLQYIPMEKSHENSHHSGFRPSCRNKTSLQKALGSWSEAPAVTYRWVKLNMQYTIHIIYDIKYILCILVYIIL